MKASRKPFFITTLGKTKQAVAISNTSSQAKCGHENVPPLSPRKSPQPLFAKSPELERRLIGRGVATSVSQYPEKHCLCVRPKAIVFCNSCGYFRHGRKKILCPQHPSVSFLYDIDKCQKCNTSFYLIEHQLL